jgi:hypothetical protein
MRTCGRSTAPSHGSGGADNGALFFCYEDIAIERLTMPAIVFRE